MPDAAVPDDLWITRTWHQHVVFDGHKAGTLLGWRPDPAAGLARSVAWHLAHPPTGAPDSGADSSAGPTADSGADSEPDFSADDTALAAAIEVPATLP